MSIRPVLETLSNLGAGALLDEAAEKPRSIRTEKPAP